MLAMLLKLIAVVLSTAAIAAMLRHMQ